MAKHRWNKDEVNDFRKKSGMMFYYNPEDSNIFVPRQYSFGYSLNYANPIAWAILAILLGFLAWNIFFRS